MFYRVEATLFFTEAHIPEQIKQALITLWQHTCVINPGQPDQECSSFDVQKCRHDQAPTAPCELIFHKDNCPT